MTSNGLGLIWTATLQLILVGNISYQPFGSGEWFHELQEVVVDYMATRDANGPGFQEALPRLAASWGMASHTFEQQSLIFDRLADVASFNRKGVCIKLKRFMSIFEGFHFMRGDLPAIRLMLRHLLFLRGVDQGACEQGEALPLQGMDHARDAKAELGKALKSKGALRVAVTLLHETNMTTLDIVLVVGKPSWGSYAARAKKVKTAKHSAPYNCRQSAGAWQDELAQCIHTSLRDRTSLRQMGVPLAASTLPAFEGVESTMLDFSLCLVGCRALSGVMHSDGYPHRFAMAFATEPRDAMAPFKNDWGS